MRPCLAPARRLQRRRGRGLPRLLSVRRRFDLDNDGAIGFPDFFLFSDQFGKPIEPTFEGLAVARTDNPRVPIVAVHEEGTQIAILADESGTQIEGAVFTQEDGKSLHVLMGDDGLPERAHAEGYTFLFDNYQNNAVDVAVVAPDGTTEIYRNIAVDPEELEALTTVPSGKTVALQEEGLTLWKAVKVGLLAASVASCAIAVVSIGISNLVGQGWDGVELVSRGDEWGGGRSHAVVAAWVSSGVRRPDTRVHRRDQAHRSP